MANAPGPGRAISSRSALPHRERDRDLQHALGRGMESDSAWLWSLQSERVATTPVGFGLGPEKSVYSDFGTLNDVWAWFPRVTPHSGAP